MIAKLLIGENLAKNKANLSYINFVDCPSESSTSSAQGSCISTHSFQFVERFFAGSYIRSAEVTVDYPKGLNCNIVWKSL